MIRRFTKSHLTALSTASIHALAMLAASIVFAGSISIATLYADDSRAVSNAPAAPATIYFATDVVPTLTRLGCNGGGCHGKATGQNGFRLSLLGYEPDVDYDAIVKEARGRRISHAVPRQSLLLLKATAQVPHGGGKRLDVDSPEHRVLHDWIAQGAAPPRANDPTLVRITITPDKFTFTRPNQSLALRVIGHYSNNVIRDITGTAVYQSNEPDIADIGENGVILSKDQSGLFAVMVRHGEQMAVFHGVVLNPPGMEPTADANPPSANPPSANTFLPVTFIDRLLIEHWKKMGIKPSALISDAEFLRRLSLDIRGTLPTTEELDRYVDDRATDKRLKVIDRMLESAEHASFFALKWADILRNRGAGYATSKQRQGTALFTGWIRDSIDRNLPYDQFATAILTASGSQEENPPTVWYRTVRTTQDYIESVAQAFLGVRIQCAQCHHHPAERWSQDDYYGLAAAFARVGRKGGFADAEVPTNETIYLASEGQLIHPRTGHAVPPRPLGGAAFALQSYDDPRRALARWMTAPDNPYFARTMANRTWAHFLGRGIVHPIDDFRSTNPPVIPELLDALAADFIAQRYDTRHLIRTICNSSVYSLSSIPNASNGSDQQSFARFYPKRLPAEVLLDAISDVLESPSRFSNVAGEFPAGTRAIELPDEAVPSQFLDVFGRPARNSACECERVSAPALGQTLALVSSNDIQQKLTTPNGYVDKLASAGPEYRTHVRSIFQRVFARPPRDSELQTAVVFLESQTDAKEGYRSLLWALLATNEFLFNH